MSAKPPRNVVLTRDGSGALAGYHDGALQFSADYSSWGIVYASDKLRFFLDDNAGAEQSAGSVARICIWSDALSAAEVVQLTDSIFDDGIEGM